MSERFESHRHLLRSCTTHLGSSQSADGHHLTSLQLIVVNVPSNTYHLDCNVLLCCCRSQVTDWVYWADVLLRTFDAATTAAALASSLGIQVGPLLYTLQPVHAAVVVTDGSNLYQRLTFWHMQPVCSNYLHATHCADSTAIFLQEPCVLHFQPQSAPLLPAHAVIVDHSRKQLLLLVRGTSTWADCLTDIVAHTEPLGTGAHGSRHRPAQASSAVAKNFFD